jgi:hypothetical protein
MGLMSGNSGIDTVRVIGYVPASLSKLALRVIVELVVDRNE